MLDESRDMQDGAGSGTVGTVAELKAVGKDAVSTAKETVSGLKEQVTERATEGVESRKSELADSLSSVVNALRAAERSLREDNQTGLADYSSSIASYVERSTGYVRDKDMNGLMSDLQRVGRENTAMFMGSSFAAGAALGRFLRASTPQPETSPEPEHRTDSMNATSDTRFGSEALS